MSTSRGHVLYVCYNGLCEPIGQSQVIPYVVGLARRGWSMTVVSHEKVDASPSERASVRARLEAAGARWLPRRYVAGSAGRALAQTVAGDVVVGLRLSRHHRIDCVHARSYLPALVAASLKRLLGARMIFDMRGFWVDEKVETGRWSKGPLYRAGKAAEQPLFGQADAIVTLTHAAKAIVSRFGSVARTGAHVSVIPTCVDVDAYAKRTEPRTHGHVVGYLGSFGARYLVDEMVAVFARFRTLRPDARLAVLSPSDPAPLYAACSRFGVPRERVSVKAVAHDDVAGELASWDATLCLVKPGFAALASCPTKFGESLAAGLPVVVNEGLGDCAEIVREHGVGVPTGLSATDLAGAADALSSLLDDPGAVAKRCVATARSLFDLEGGVDEFDAIYSRMAPG